MFKCYKKITWNKKRFKKRLIRILVVYSIFCLLLGLKCLFIDNLLNACENRYDSYDYHQYIDFESFDNANGSDHFIVPNIVHMIYLDRKLPNKKPKFEFAHMIALYSIFLNQNPDKIYIHCDVCEFND